MTTPWPLKEILKDSRNVFETGHRDDDQVTGTTTLGSRGRVLNPCQQKSNITRDYTYRVVSRSNTKAALWILAI